MNACTQRSDVVAAARAAGALQLQPATLAQLTQLLERASAHSVVRFAQLWWLRAAPEHAVKSPFLVSAGLPCAPAPAGALLSFRQLCERTPLLAGQGLPGLALARGIAGGVDTTSDAPMGLNEKLRKILLQLSRAKTAGQRLAALSQVRPQMLLRPALPRNGEPRTGLSMGEHCELMALASTVLLSSSRAILNLYADSNEPQMTPRTDAAMPKPISSVPNDWRLATTTDLMLSASKNNAQMKRKMRPAGIALSAAARKKARTTRTRNILAVSCVTTAD
jgi:hypothetical protein